MTGQNMMPPVTTNQPSPMKQHNSRPQRRRQAESINPSDTQSNNVTSGASVKSTSTKPATATMITSATLVPFPKDNRSTFKKSMDPPAALDPADLLARLSKMNIGMNDNEDIQLQNNGIHNNGNISSSQSMVGNSSHSITTTVDESNRSGIFSSSGGSVVALPSTTSSQTTLMTMTTASDLPKKQIGALRSKYFQPTRIGGGRQRRPQPSVPHASSSQPPQAQPKSSGAGGGSVNGLALNQLNKSPTTTATESMTTDNSYSRFSGSTFEGGQGGSGGGGRNAGDVSHSIGTFSVPTFKEKETPSKRRPLTQTLRNGRGSNLKTYRSERMHNSSGGEDGRDSSARRRMSAIPSRANNNNGNTAPITAPITTTTTTRGRSEFSNMLSVDMEDTLDDSSDDWMEEALLHGIPAANSGVTDTSTTTADLKTADSQKNHAAAGEADSVGGASSNYAGQLLSQLLNESDLSAVSAPPPKGEHQSDLSQSTSGRISRIKVSSSQRMQKRSSSQQRSEKELTVSSGQRSRRAVRYAPKSNKYRRSKSSDFSLEVTDEKKMASRYKEDVKIEAARRVTIGDLTNSELSLEDLIKNHAQLTAKKDDGDDDHGDQQQQQNHRRGGGGGDGGGSSPSRSPSRSKQPRRPLHQNPPSSPSETLSNIPVLPTIKTYKVTKNRPDEPAGLFLTKAKNGAVLVHSLSPESLFRKSTPLHPGQEVLSVNEKRVNDPKMAATLITQAKRNLSLRISTVERSRGFLYCQVKRRSGKAKAVVDSSAAPAAAAGGTAREGAGKTGTGAAAAAGGARKRGRGVPAASGPSHHGVRFVTTSVDGVRRGIVTEGLVRVSHIDPQGLFANSHPMNRLRVGGIVLTVNGTPVTNGRTALENVMGSRQLVEVLHCDERVWREDWVKDGLEQVLSGRPQKDPNEIASILFAKKDTGTSDINIKKGGEGKKDEKDSEKVPWDLEWKLEKEEVTLRKKGQRGVVPAYAFKLVFNNSVGTCHPELVDDNSPTSMPPTDEFDVSLLVKMVNDSQRTMMTVLQNMLRRANLEVKFAAGHMSDRALIERPPSSLVLAASNIGDVSDSNELGNIEGERGRHSYDFLTELVEGEDGGVSEELCELASSLLRVDSRDRPKRNTLRVSTEGNDMNIVPYPDKQMFPRRGSTMGIQGAIEGIMPGDIERWRLEQWKDQPAGSTKIREYSARQHKMEEEDNAKDNYSSRNSNASISGSMFSTDMLEDFLDYLEDHSQKSTAHGNSSGAGNNLSQEFGEGQGSRSSDNDSPPSPRDDANKWDDNNTLRISPAAEKERSHDDEEETAITEYKKGDDDMAYITGVWRDVASKYNISDVVVGQGGFGEVRDCYDKKTGQIYVVKTIFKPRPDDTTKINLIRNEILLLHEAHHPNIVELRDLFEDDKYVHIVMERCTGGDLFDRVVNEHPRKLRTPAEAMKHEGRTASSMRSILHVLKYLHSKGIVHRDIKPEHFLLTSDERETQKIKLIDFGLARKHKPGSAPMTTFTGSPSFVAPEVIARRYDHMCDMFSVGVTAYFMLTGMLPFDGPTDEETFDLISAGRFKFPSLPVLSDDAKDFISKLLTTDTKRRMSAVKALSHPWLTKAASC